jgi:selenocysteine lyase/cysteine desulfurase
MTTLRSNYNHNNAKLYYEEKTAHHDQERRLSDATSALIEVYPEYKATLRLDELRAAEYAYIDEQDHVYLDYTGSGLAAYSQLRAHQERLSHTLYGNPHSTNPTSETTTQLINRARARVLAHFNAPQSEYAVIFTPNATGAAKLVGEAYPFSRRAKLVLTTDNHNSINGLREFARRRHARTIYVPAQPPDLRVDLEMLTTALRHRHLPGFESGCDLRFKLGGTMKGVGRGKRGEGCRRGLFAYPAQSNFSGVQHPLSWVGLAQQHGFDVLLDAAAYLPTQSINLAEVQPEFLMVSWYKLFGYPTGVGCLVAKRSALARLSRPSFSGGTIKAVSVAIPWHEMASDESAFEDGTLNFLAIPDVIYGLDWLHRIGWPIITQRVRCLTAWFLSRLCRLEHSDGTSMTRLYGPADSRARGGTITFNLLDAAGNVVDERLVVSEAAAARISLRSGCFCNPGVAEDALGLHIRNLLPLRHMKQASLDEIINIIGLPSGGAIRVSFGLVSTAGDVDRFFAFATKTYRDRITTTAALPPRDRC